MKKVILSFMAILLAFSLAACGNSAKEETLPEENTVGEETLPEENTVGEETLPEENPDGEETLPEKNSDGEELEPKNTAAEADDLSTQTEQESNMGTDSDVLIVYFSMPEDVDVSGVDSVAGASVVVRDSDIMGNTEYVAGIVQEMTGGDLFRIETVEDYPADHEPLVDQAADEQNENFRPELKNHIENPEQYDTIILGFPNWWGDLPMALYSFLEEYDFGGKTIVPFVTHGGSGFSNTRDMIAELQPEAMISDNTLSLSRNDVANSEDEIRQWAESISTGN